MIDDQFKALFQKAGQVDGRLVERCISAFYTDFAQTWQSPKILIDGGAHSGYHSKRMASLDEVERVIAIEANPDSYNRLKATIDKAKLNKIELTHAALQDDEALNCIEFYISTSHPGRSGINPVMRNLDNTVFAQKTFVPATTIDRLCKGFESQISFIKLDLEGGEFAAFRGASRTLLLGQPVCVFENGPMTPRMNGYTIDDFLSYLASVGLKGATFFGEVATKENMDFFWYAWAFPISSFEKHACQLSKLVVQALENVDVTQS